MALLQDLIEDYHYWLCDLMRCDLPEHRDYEELMYHLDHKEFTWIHPMDDNRDGDGYELRKEYFFDHGYDIRDTFDGPRSCLEVLAALSRRIEIEIMGEPGNDHIERWFWIMISNLGLNQYTDEYYDFNSVDKILDIWLNRQFDFNGKMSIFPLKKCHSDQRKTDIWYQMQNYLVENYPI